MLDMTKSWRGWHKNFFNSSELIVPATEILNNRAKEMKAEISELFKTFREVDYSIFIICLSDLTVLFID